MTKTATHPTDGQGQMTNLALTRVLHQSVAALLPDIDVAAVAREGGKTALLRRVMDRHGPAAVLQIGQAIRHILDHPVVAALTSARRGRDVLERWMRLERFGHTRNRTRLLEGAVDAEAVVEHFALGDENASIDPVNDLFIWGVLIALLEVSGFEDVEAELVGAPAATQIYANGSALPVTVLPSDTAQVRLAWSARGAMRVSAPPSEPSSDVATALSELFATDLLTTWRLAEAAPRLAMSTRTLQRHLTRAGTSFTSVMHRTRIDAALGLMPDKRLGLADVAFCVGFADQAHFTRVFRAQLEVPPSAYRGLL